MVCKLYKGRRGGGTTTKPRFKQRTIAGNVIIFGVERVVSELLQSYHVITISSKHVTASW